MDQAKLEPIERGYEAHSLVFDETKPKEINKAINKAINDFEANTGSIDILVNNAGIQIRVMLEDFFVDDFDGLMKTNVNGVFYVSQAVARHMIKREEGKIINIASVQSSLA